MQRQLASFQQCCISLVQATSSVSQVDTFRKTGRALYRDYKMDPTFNFGGTISTIIIQQRSTPYLYCANVGDSKAVLGQWVDGKAVATPLTEVRVPYV